MSQSVNQRLEAATHHLGTLLNDVISESPSVNQVLQSIKEDGYDVSVEFSLVLKEKIPSQISLTDRAVSASC